ncbi:hypothetical protein RDABS01_035720 [Bienertia sinuspersici]
MGSLMSFVQPKELKLGWRS